MAPTPKATTGTVGVTKAGVGNRLSASDWVQLLSAFGPAALSAIGGAGQASYDRKRQEQLDALDRAQADYLRRQGARAGLSSFYADQLAQQRSGAQALANAMPLGAEQDLATRMALLRGLSAAGQAGPAAETSTNPALRARLAAEPTRNLLAGWARPDVVQAISPEATARSLAERRKALAGLDPNFQFGSMGDYGVPDLGGEVSGYASSVQGRRAQAENTLLNYLQQQMDEASQPLVPTGPQTGMTGQTTQKKTPWWKRALKVAATAAPIVAAPFTSGATLALIGAGSGALAGGLDGGMKGAMMGGALGATAGLGGGGAASTVARQQGESVRSAIQRSILNPQALTRLAGAGIGGDVGQAMSIASSALPGAREYQGGFRGTLRKAGFAPEDIPGTPDYQMNIQGRPGETLDFTEAILNQARGLTQGQVDAAAPAARATRGLPSSSPNFDMPMVTQATQQGMFGQPPAQTFGGWNATQGMFAPQAPATPMSAPVTGSRPPLPRVTLPPQAPGQPGQPGQPRYFGDRGVAGPTYFGAPGAPLTPPMPTQMLGGLQAPITYGNWGNATATSNFLLMMLRNGNLTYPQYLQALQRMGLQPPRPAAGGGSGGGW